MAELTDEMRAAVMTRMGFSLASVDPWMESAIEDLLAVAERNLRAAVAEEIRQALAADKADDDVTSGEAIWEQTGYRRGLADAAEIAAGGAS